MGLWAKSVVIFNAIREHCKQSIRSLADRTGLSKSSVHRHLQAIDRRDRYPESSLWETEPGAAWLGFPKRRFRVAISAIDCLEMAMHAAFGKAGSIRQAPDALLTVFTNRVENDNALGPQS